MELLLTWFTKSNISFFIERSQEDMVKFIVKGSVSGKLWIAFRYLLSAIILSMSTFEKGCGCIKILLYKFEVK